MRIGNLDELAVNLAKPLPLPDLCSAHDWSPIAAGPGQSSLAAVLAGFTFSGAVVVLSVRGGQGARDAANHALKLLFTAFFGLGTVAYLLADLGGEQACPRAETDEVLAGAILGTFTVTMIVAIAWLTAAYWQGDMVVLQFLRGLVYVASGFVVLLLATSSAGYLNAELDYGSHLGVSVALYVTAGTAGLAGLTRFLVRERVKPRRALATPRPRAADAAAVSRCTRLSLIYLALSSVTTGVALSIPAKYYYSPPPWTAYAAAWSALVLPLVVLALALLALPRSSQAEYAPVPRRSFRRSPRSAQENVAPSRASRPRLRPAGPGPRRSPRVASAGSRRTVRSRPLGEHASTAATGEPHNSHWAADHGRLDE